MLWYFHNTGSVTAISFADDIGVTIVTIEHRNEIFPIETIWKIGSSLETVGLAFVEHKKDEVLITKRHIDEQTIYSEPPFKHFGTMIDRNETLGHIFEIFQQNSLD